MSRCFPFPPPGYEKRPRSDHTDLLAKEKRREKKHRKEKKERENKDGKEKKDRNKEKKDRREKHREKKKDKDRDKDNARTSAERSESQTEFSHDGRIGDSSLEAVEARDTKFMDELGRRIKDEKGAATQLVTNNNSSLQKGAATTKEERERIAVNKLLTNSILSDQRRNDGPEQKINNTVHPVPRLPGRLVSERAIQKEKAPVLGNLASTGRSGNGGTFQPLEKNMAPSQRKPEGPKTIKAAVAEKGGPSDWTTSSSNVSMRKTTDGMGPSVESSSGSIYRNIEGMGFDTEVAKEKGNKALPNNFILAKDGNNGMGLCTEKIAEKGVHTNEKSKDRGGGEGKRGRDKDRDKDEKKKRRDKDRHKDKEKENGKKREKGEHSNKDQDDPREGRGQIDSLSVKPLPQHIGNEIRAGADEAIRKRMDFATNGFLHENDMPSAKLARTIPSNLVLDSGRTWQPSHKFASSSSIKPPATNNLKAEMLLDNKEHHINGVTEAQHAANRGSGEVSVTSPHPDSKYLSQVYSVPKMEEWLEHDEQEWLFCNDRLRLKPVTKSLSDKPPEVWAEAIHIESEDVIALPYIVPL